jgi:hypothetical protein
MSRKWWLYSFGSRSCFRIGSREVWRGLVLGGYVNEMESYMSIECFSLCYAMLCECSDEWMFKQSIISCADGCSIKNTASNCVAHELAVRCAGPELSYFVYKCKFLRSL